MRSIGWVIWDSEKNEPYRSVRSPGHWYGRKEPIKVYKSRGRAETYGPKFSITKEVFVKDEWKC